MNEDKIKGIKAIVSYYNKVELLKEEIDKLKSIRESNTFIMTIFLAGENSVDNYTMSITSDNMMQNDYGVLYQDFIDKLIEGKEKELASYNMVLEKFSENLSIFDLVYLIISKLNKLWRAHSKLYKQENKICV